MSDVYMNQLRGDSKRFLASSPSTADHAAEARAVTPIKRGTMHAPPGGQVKFPK